MQKAPALRACKSLMYQPSRFLERLFLRDYTTKLIEIQLVLFKRHKKYI